MPTLSELIIKIGADASGLHNELGKTQNEIQNAFGNVSPVDNMTNALTGTTGAVEALSGKLVKMAGLAAGGFGLTSLVSSAVEAGENVYQLSQRLGVTAGEASTLNRILKQTGGDVDMAAKSIMRLDSTLSNGGKSAEKMQKWLDVFGVSVKDAEGNLLPLNQQLENLAEGYTKAQKAGHAQEFLMNTLGTRGLALAKTLQQYAEAKENAARVQSIGLDVNEMHQVDREMKVMSMQMGQIKLIVGNTLAPIAAEILPKISNELAYGAKLVKEHKDGIIEISGGLIKVLAIYKSIQAARAVASTVGKAVDTVRGALGSTKEIAQEEALTKAQERAIAKRERAIEAAALKEQRAYAKSVQAMEISEEEKSRLVAEHTARRTMLAEEQAVRERAIMTQMFQQINAERTVDTARAAESEAQKAEAAQVASAKIIEANTAAAESNAEIVAANESVTVSETAAGEAAQIAGAQKVEASTAAKVAAGEEMVANDALTTSITATGAAAGVAGGQKVSAETASKLAVGETTVAQNLQKAAVVETGVQAQVTGAKMATSAAGAVGPVRTLTSAVWGLAMGWWGVAAAIAAAVAASAGASQSRIDAERSKYTEYNGESYTKGDDGQWYKVENETGNVIDASTNTGDDYDDNGDANYSGINTDTEQGYVGQPIDGGSYSNGMSPVRDAFLIGELNNKAGEDWLGTAQGKQWAAEQARAEAEAQQQQMQSQMKDLLAGLTQAAMPNVGGAGTRPGSGGGTGPGGGASTTPKTIDVDVPVGQVAAQIAEDNFNEGDQWMGNVTSNPRIQCDSFTANIYNQAKISDIGGYSTSGTINDAAFRAANAYHEAGDGYTPQAGDLVDSAHHVGIYLGNGKVRSRDSDGGVTTRSLEDWDNTFGITGYGSLSEATGGMQVKQTLDNAQKAAQEAEKKRNDAIASMNRLNHQMAEAIMKNTGTEQASERAKVFDDIRAKQLQINKAKKDGADVTKSQELLNKYAVSQLGEMLKKYHELREEQKHKTAQAVASATHDYEALAQAEYDATVNELKKEREKKEKELMADDNDYKTRNMIAEWYYAKVREAEDKLMKAKREAHDKYVSYLIEEGNLSALVNELDAPKSKGQSKALQNIQISDNQKLAKQYVAIWKDAHGTMEGYIADVSNSVYSSLSDSMAEFVRGTKSAKGVFQDFGNSVLSMMAKIAAQRVAASWMTNILGMFGSHSSSAWSLSNGTTLDKTFGLGGNMGSFKYNYTRPQYFAEGGIVTAPTLGLIGEAGTHEAVIPLTDNNLRAIGGHGGGVTVNITNKTDSNVKMQNSSYNEDLGKWVLDVVVDGASRNRGGFGANLKTALGGV